MTSVLKMTWDLTGNNGTITWNLPDPKSGLTLDEARNVMNMVIDGQIIMKNGLDTSTIKDVYIYQTNRVELPDE